MLLLAITCIGLVVCGIMAVVKKTKSLFTIARKVFIEERLAKGLLGLIALVGLSGMIKSSEADEKRLFATR